MNPKIISKIKNLIPSPLLNAVLLRFPALYKIGSINFESNLTANGGLDDLLDQLKIVSSLDGDIIECGSSRCGSSIVMANYLNANSINKKIYALDSFAGFDLDELERERQLGLTDVKADSFTSTSYEYVNQKIRTLQLDNYIEPIKGYFQETLPRIGDKNYCYALVDCDLQDSLIYCAKMIWPRLSRNGRILFDDYTHAHFQGAKIGVDKFVRQYEHEIAEHGLLKRLYYVVKK